MFGRRGLRAVQRSWIQRNVRENGRLSLHCNVPTFHVPVGFGLQPSELV